MCTFSSWIWGEKPDWLFGTPLSLPEVPDAAFFACWVLLWGCWEHWPQAQSPLCGLYPLLEADRLGVASFLSCTVGAKLGPLSGTQDLVVSSLPFSITPDKGLMLSVEGSVLWERSDSRCEEGVASPASDFQTHLPCDPGSVPWMRGLSWDAPKPKSRKQLSHLCADSSACVLL